MSPPTAQERQMPPLEFFRLLKRLLAYTRPHPRELRRLILAVSVRAVQLSLVSWALTAVINGPIVRGDFRGILLGTLGFAALVLLTQATMCFRMFYALKLGEAVIHDIRRDAFAHLQTLTASFFQRMSAGRLISRMTSDIEAIRTGVQDVCFVSAVNIGQMVVTGVILACKDWVLFLVAATIAPLLWSVNNRFRTEMSVGQRRASASFSRLTANVAESIDGIRVTQGFVRQEVNSLHFSHLVTDHSVSVLKKARVTAIFLPMLEFSTQFFTALLLIVGSYRVLAHGAPLGTVVQFLFMVGLFFDPFRVIGTQYNQALISLVGAERVFRLLDEKPDWEDAPGAADAPPIAGRVEMRNVAFCYLPGRPILRSVSFVAEPGQMIALVGHTGSGKSSIINLLTKAYLPNEGEVLIDGREIRQIRARSLRRQLGIVQQQNFLFTGTVLENIRFSRPEADEAEVREAARSLGLLELIESLPGGFHTAVTEAGGGLSLGQRQAVCFIRALLARPRILILDEATSSIDAVTEARLQRALELLLAGRTSFVVAHRLSTIRRADTILVLDQGCVAERGTHETLLARGGIYAGLHAKFLLNTAA